MILLDTHTLLWWALEPERLSPTATKLCAQMERDGGFVSTISIWEIAIKVERKKLELPLSIEDLVGRLEASAPLTLVPVDAAIWIHSARFAWAHRDPADRVIVATAELKGVPVLTKDAVLHAEAPARCIW